MKDFIICMFAWCMAFTGAHAQGFTPPSHGKSVVYFVRVSNYQSFVPFVYFHQDKVIADFAGKNYVRYETEPGNQLFWVSAENKQFLTTHLSPNSTYVVLVDARMGNAMPKVALVPMHTRHREMVKVRHMIKNKAPLLEDHKRLEEESRKLAPFIERSLNEYEAKNAELEVVDFPVDYIIPLEKALAVPPISH